MADTMIQPEEPENAGYELPVSSQRRHRLPVNLWNSNQLLAALEQHKLRSLTVLRIARWQETAQPAWCSSGLICQ